ncbi:phage/plasmid primase, P4 family [Streptococcus danieliae]|uniref:DNA primase family protein n=1 Tax=Streptococcus danieliae TaxID=747656 RepID=UPI0026F15AFF|nr:DNA primase family protein [Streptococcus danieliae]
MKELMNRLYNDGEEWRAEHTEIKINEKTGETVKKIEMPRVPTVAKVLKNYCHFTFIGEGATTDISKLYLYDLDLGYYVASDDLLRKLIVKFDTRLTSDRFFREIKNFIRTSTIMRRPLEDYRYIPVANGVFNLETKELEPFSPDFIIKTKIKTAYNPDSKLSTFGGRFDFLEWLKSIACGDDELVKLLWQIMNEAINPNRTRKKMVLLVGDGNNGKGTFQSLLENLIGRENISNIKPDQFGKEFYLASLDGKVCNIGDDISNKYLDEVSDLMSVVSGDSIQVNVKGSQPYEARYKLLCLFSGNSLPRARNKTQGWYRRLCIVPFNADFNGQTERPEIKNQYLKNRNLLEWVLYEILNMDDFEKFIEPQATKDMLEEYKEDNDYIRSFVFSQYLPNGLDGVEHVPTATIRRWLDNYTHAEGITNPSFYGASKRIAGVLTKEGYGKFVVKTGRVRDQDRSILEEVGALSNELNGTSKGIHKIT